MARQTTGEAKLGRPFLYTSEDEHPVTLSLRVPRDLYTRLEAYRKQRRQSRTELLIEGLKLVLDDGTDPYHPASNGTQHYSNTAMSVPQMDLTPDMLDAENVDAMPLGVSVAMPQQPAAPGPPVSPHASTLADKAAVLAQLDAWKAAGVSLQTMADRLNTSEVPTFSGKGSWKKGTIGNLLAPRPAPVA